MRCPAHGDWATPSAQRLLTVCLGASFLPAAAQRPHGRRLDRAARFVPVAVPWPEDTKFHDNDRRHHWCEEDKRLIASFGADKTASMSFRHGLENSTISVVFILDPQYVSYNASSRTLTGGFFPELLQEASKRARFKWRSSFAVIEPPNSSLGETFDGWMHWATHHYDMVVGDFSATQERMASGFKFGFPILDESPVLVSVLKEKDPPMFETAFAFHRPFSPTLWLTILAAMFATAFVYLMSEADYSDFRDQQKVEDHERTCHKTVDACGHSVYLIMTSFTGGGSLLPSSALGKTVSLTWTFLVLLFTAAYTANLASQLVVTSTPTAPIGGIQDAINRNIPVCVYKGGAFDTMIQERYPELPVKYPRKWGYHNVRNGNCGAIVKDRFDFDIDEGRISKNPDCDLGIVGQPIIEVGGSFITSHDSSTWCSSMVMDIFSIATHDMYNDGWLADAKLRLMATLHDQSCSQDAHHHTVIASLTVFHFGGMFLIHLVVSALSLVFYFLRVKPAAKRKRSRVYSPMGDVASTEESQ